MRIRQHIKKECIQGNDVEASLLEMTKTGKNTNRHLAQQQLILVQKKL